MPCLMSCKIRVLQHSAPVAALSLLSTNGNRLHGALVWPIEDKVGDRKCTDDSDVMPHRAPLTLLWRVSARH